MLDLTKASGMQARGMAINLAACECRKPRAFCSPNFYAVKNRIKATANVAKLTGVMKLVASSKLRGVEEVLEQGRLFGVCISRLCTQTLLIYSQESLIASVGKDEPTLSTEEKKINRLVVLLTTDRGLCGCTSMPVIS